MTEEEMKAKIKALEEENAKLKAEKEEGDEPEHNAKAEGDEDEDEKKEADAEEDEEDEKKAKAVLAAARRITGRKSLVEVEGALMALGASSRIAESGARASKVSELIASGKLAPADKSWAMNADPRAFAAYVKATEKAVIVPVGQKHSEPVNAKAPGADELTAEEKALAKASGLSKDAIIKARGAKYTTKEID